jgi:hypothetical protein
MIVLGLLVVVALASVSTAAALGEREALTPSQIGKCIDLSGRTSLRLANVDNGLGLTREQILEAKARVSDFWRGRATAWTLDGLGFTPEQEATFTQRVNAKIAKSSWPLGSPCPPFKSRQRVMKDVKALLVYNGFRPAMTFTVASPRQITFRAIQDGIQYHGVVVKTKAREILINITSTHSGGTSKRMPLKYDA